MMRSMMMRIDRGMEHGLVVRRQMMRRADRAARRGGSAIRRIVNLSLFSLLVVKYIAYSSQSQRNVGFAHDACTQI
ncbi:hypothetical protein PENSPDRAFT_398606 [Peniophora sp. CONT]|nr:hypothetical protein PENSPDRAFT_398606 [Peniophora sp. CONT]